MSDKNTADDPLADLYEDGTTFNRSRLANSLKGIIGIDEESGEPIYKKGYQKLSNKEKFVAQLAYRKAAVALDEIDENDIGISSGEAAKNMGVSKSTVQNYPGKLEFVETERELGGYYLPNYGIEGAIDMLSSENE